MTDSVIKNILKERGARYGSFRENAALSQCLKDAVRAMDGWSGLGAHHKEAIDMSLHKISRIVNGDPNYKDSWLDVQGYAQRVLDEIEKDDNA